MLKVLQVLVPILVIIISTGGVFFTKLYFENREEKRKNKQLEIKVKDNSIFVEFMFTQSDRIAKIIADILKETKATRVHLFSASNGKTDLKYTNNLVGYEIINGEIVKSTEAYRPLEYDYAYNCMLKRVENESKVVLNIPVMENCMLKTIYKMIKIRHSVIHFSLRCEINDENDRIFYPSIATTDVEPFTEEELFFIKLKNDELKHCLKEILHLTK